MSFARGQDIGAYRIIEQLGSGGMATVFKAYHAALDRYVAIKVMHRAYKGDESFLARFKREARVVAKLDHPNIVPVYDFSEHEGSPYLVMRFIEGQTLKSRLAQGQLTFAEILDVIRPMGDALAYAHENGVLHRDIKPSNVLLSRDGRVYLTDFGLARIVQAGESSMTRDSMVGTPFYISPEQATGDSELDSRTDIYSFGIVLYELSTGRVPFQADMPFVVIHDHIYTPLPMPTTINPNLPPELERVLLKSLAKDPDNRYDSATELVQAAEHAVPVTLIVPSVRLVSAAEPADAATQAPGKQTVVGTESTAERLGKPGRRSRRKIMLLMLGGVALLCLGLAALVLAARGLIEHEVSAPVVAQPTYKPAATKAAVVQALPSSTATATSTGTPTATPTATPTSTPSATSTATPTPNPTSTPTPTLTPVPTSTPRPTVSCVYDAELVEIGDPYRFWYVNSRPSFSLLLRNSGTCPWPEDTSLVLVSENTLDWPESWLIGGVALDETTEVTIGLMAPDSPQTLLLVWQVRGPEELPIGSEITRTLRIGARPTATPPPIPRSPPEPSLTPQPDKPGQEPRPSPRSTSPRP